MSDPETAYSEPHSQVPSETTRALSSSPARSSSGTTISTSSRGRFYRPDEMFQLPPFRDSSPDSDAGLFPPRQTFLERQATALSNLASLHEWISVLEVTRLTKTRMGIPIWARSWQQAFRPQHVRVLGALATSALRKIDTLFTTAAADVHTLLSRYQQEVLNATSKEEIDRIFARMETEVPHHRNRRRRAAQKIFDKLRRRIQERLPLFIRDDVMDQMKRTLFALDPNCDYDEVPVAEFEEMIRDSDQRQAPPPLSASSSPPLTLIHVLRDPHMRDTDQGFVHFRGLDYPLPPGHRPVGYTIDYRLTQ